MKLSKIVIGSTLVLASSAAMAIPTEVSSELTAQATEVATYTGPAVVLALAVVAAGAAIKWTKKFVSKAL
jgi:hypothetical protein